MGTRLGDNHNIGKIIGTRVTNYGPWAGLTSVYRADRTRDHCLRHDENGTGVWHNGIR